MEKSKSNKISRESYNNRFSEEFYLPPHQEIIQFDDGASAIRYNRSGDVLKWQMNKWAPSENRGSEIAIIQTQSDREFALFSHYLVRMPKFGSRFSRLGETLAAKRHCIDIAFAYELLGTLPDLTIDQPWVLLNRDNDPVTQVMLQYKINRVEATKKVDASNPFVQAKRLKQLLEIPETNWPQE